MQNRRQKLRKSTAKPALGKEESQDTMMFDGTASEPLEEPVEVLASPLLPTTKAKNPKGRAAKAPIEREDTSRPARVRRQPAVEAPSMPIRVSPGIDNSSANEATVMDHGHPSGDSNGSASPSTGTATPTTTQRWVATRPERPFHEYNPHELEAAACLSLLIPRARNPAYNPLIFVCDP
jgi:hypothetical protein